MIRLVCFILFSAYIRSLMTGQGEEEPWGESITFEHKFDSALIYRNQL